MRKSRCRRPTWACDIGYLSELLPRHHVESEELVGPVEGLVGVDLVDDRGAPEARRPADAEPLDPGHPRGVVDGLGLGLDRDHVGDLDLLGGRERHVGNLVAFRLRGVRPALLLGGGLRSAGLLGHAVRLLGGEQCCERAGGRTGLGAEHSAHSLSW